MSTDSLWLMLLWITTGLIVANLANKKGRNPYLWFTIGTFLGILGLIILLFISPRNQQKNYFAKKKTTIRQPLSDIELFFYKNPSNKLWYYLDNEHKQTGPVSLQRLNNQWKNEIINSSTYVWNEDMDNWKKIKEFFPQQPKSNTLENT